MQQSSHSFSSGLAGPGQSSSSTMVVSSKKGRDGKLQTERYASSSVADGSRKAKEAQSAYSNSATGMDKVSMERQYGNRGRKMVRGNSNTI
jgi:hypothetical protein